MKVLAVDPGNENSAYALYLARDGHLLAKGIVSNAEMRIRLMTLEYEHLAIEMIKSYGMIMGDSILETCVWIGRFIECWDGGHTLIPRKSIAAHICGSARANDSNIRQALINRYGGSKSKAIGTKKAKGPLYGVKKDMWSALAVAIYWTETQWAKDDFLY